MELQNAGDGDRHAHSGHGPGPTGGGGELRADSKVPDADAGAARRRAGPRRQRSGFLCFAIIVVQLEDELGVDPFSDLDDAMFPVSFAEFVQLYEAAVQSSTSSRST